MCSCALYIASPQDIANSSTLSKYFCVDETIFQVQIYLVSSCSIKFLSSLVSIFHIMKMIWFLYKLRWFLIHFLYFSIFNKPAFCNGAVDPHLINEMVSKHGFDSAKVVHCVKRNRPGEALAMYHLLAKRARRLKHSTQISTARSIGSDCNLNKDSDADTSDEPNDETIAAPSPSKPATNNGGYEKPYDVPDSKDSANTTITTNKDPELNGEIEHPSGENKENQVQHHENYSVADLSDTFPNKKQETTAQDSACSSDIVRQKTPEIKPKKDIACEHSTAYHDQVNHESKLPKLNSEANQNIVHPEKKLMPIILRDNANIRPTSVPRNITGSRDFATPSYKDTRKSDNESSKVKVTRIDARIYEVGPTDRASSVRLQQYEVKRHESVASNNSAVKLPGERPRTSGHFWEKRSVNQADSYPSRMSGSKKLTPRIMSMFQKNRKQSVPKMTKYTPKSSYCDRDGSVFDSNILPSITQVSPEFKYTSVSQREKSRSLRSTGTVKDIIEKFDGMTENSNERQRPIQLRQTNYEANDHRSYASPLMMYKAPREKQATRLYLQNSSASRQSTRSKMEEPYFTGKNDSSFVSHFSDRSRNAGSFFKNNGSASSASQRAQSRGVWYKSLV